MSSRVRLVELLVCDFGLTVSTVVVIPKKHTIFRFEIPQPGSTPNPSEEDAAKEERNDEPALVFELHGSQFAIRAPDRATKSFKPRNMNDL